MSFFSLFTDEFFLFLRSSLFSFTVIDEDETKAWPFSSFSFFFSPPLSPPFSFYGAACGDEEGNFSAFLLYSFFPSPLFFSTFFLVLFYFFFSLPACDRRREDARTFILLSFLFFWTFLSPLSKGKRNRKEEAAWLSPSIFFPPFGLPLPPVDFLFFFPPSES